MSHRIRELLVCSLLVAVPAAAQRAPASKPAVATIDTARLLDSLTRQASGDAKNASLWHRIAVIAAESTRPVWRSAFMRRQEDIAHVRLADSAFYRATQLAPDSAVFALDYARFSYDVKVDLLARAIDYAGRALAAAQRIKDSAVVARSADLLGMLRWRRYEPLQDRRSLQGLNTLNFVDLMSDPRAIESFLEQKTTVVRPPLGTGDAEAALQNFRIAVDADPNDDQARRHLYMVLADRSDWTELLTVASKRTHERPWDSWAWLARGLAEHRAGGERAANASFDSALAVMSAEDRSRLTRPGRLFKVADSARVDSTLGAPGTDRDASERLFWRVVDPLRLVRGNELRSEYYSRTVYAELRWSVDDFGVHGVDSDRGQIYVRYGPPPVSATFPPSKEVVEADCSEGDCGSAAASGSVIEILWYYPLNRMHFVFLAPPTYGTAKLASIYAKKVEQGRNNAPVLWNNLPVLAHGIDTVETQLSRFRAPGDSMDLIVMADIPLKRLARTSGSPVLQVETMLDVIDAKGEGVLRDSLRIPYDGHQPVDHHTWRKRLPPTAVVYRVEALQPDSLRGARSGGTLDGWSPSGFAMSDLVIAQHVQPRSDSPARWTDFLITPSPGALAASDTLGLLWETYDLGAKDGSARYRVNVSVTKEAEAGSKGIAMKVLSGVHEALSGGGPAGGSTLSYERQAGASPVTVDYLSLALPALASGTYKVTVQVTDLATSKSAQRERRIRVEGSPAH